MTANIRINTSVRNARLDQIRAAMDAGSGPAVIRFYSGTQPATPETAVTTQTLLAECTFSDPSAPAASGGVLTFSAITRDNSANASDTVTWARVLDSNGVAIFDCDVGTSDATIIVPTTSVVATQPFEVSSFTITEPEDMQFTP